MMNDFHLLKYNIILYLFSRENASKTQTMTQTRPWSSGVCVESARVARGEAVGTK